MLRQTQSGSSYVNPDEAVAYLRLSKDDGAGESSSIAAQRKIIRSYAKENGFNIVKEYVDDGYSGTNLVRVWQRY